MEDFVTYEQALRLKELGFDWKCGFHYDSLELNHPLNETKYRVIYGKTTFFKAPTLSQAQKWLRENGIEVGVFADFDGELPNGKWMWLMRKFNTHLYDTVFPEENINYDTYEQSLSAGIDRALGLLKDM